MTMNGVYSLSRTILTHPRRLWGLYISKLNKHPVQTKMMTSLCAAMIGDSLAQTISRPSNATDWKFDWQRTLRLCLFNATMGFIGHHYYGYLDRSVMTHAPKAPVTVATKVAIDQLLFSPLCTLYFYAYKCISEQRPQEYFDELNEKLVPTIHAGWKLWIPAHVINFALIPTQHRILYANVVSVAGTYILSRAAAGDYTRGRAGKGVATGKRKEMSNEVLFDGVNVKLD